MLWTIVNNSLSTKNKIALYTKCLRSSGALIKKVKPVVGRSKRRRHHTCDDKDTVTTAGNLAVMVSNFFKNYSDFTLLIIAGTNEHEQLIFLKKTLKPNAKVYREYNSKVYDSDAFHYKICLPIQSFFNKIKLKTDQYEELIYDEATHRLYNNDNQCAVLVALEIKNCMKYGRTPFVRKGLTFQRVERYSNK